jgi:hypothetical protein
MPIVAGPNATKERQLNHPEIIKLQKFLQQKFSNRNIDVRPRNKQNDSVEVYLGEEFLGLIYADDEDGDARTTSRWRSSKSIWMRSSNRR